ncbi:Flp pilus assembly protein TadB [Branchiibius hedensis]|uniref:Type II secretion system (T2SS), protein F n=1 Tax=Branchiibius hedensis TaxID=672460 RepID=A0A2Y8ZYF2_9MICO|nr:type II secretion system F family protein [Branchiibius hedensis]PWJ27498.1 Flp pilus assembly protein TadB [Branchiibius hedensis]SSA36308.1 Type II secretion system (T2SS), protein F [Branchiibius hedensis]
MSLLVALLVAFAVIAWPRPLIPLPVRRPADHPAQRRVPSFTSGRRRQVLRRAAIMQLLGSLAPALRAGVPPAVAVANVARLVANSVPDAPFGHSMEELAVRAEAGLELGPTFRQLASDFDLPQVEVVAAAWSLSDDLGCSLTDAVATAKELLQAEDDRESALRLATAGPRATMHLLTGLPVAGVGIAALAGVPPTQLYTGVAGLAALLIGAVLILLGRWWSGRLVQRCVRTEALS